MFNCMFIVRTPFKTINVGLFQFSQSRRMDLVLDKIQVGFACFQLLNEQSTLPVKAFV